MVMVKPTEMNWVTQDVSGKLARHLQHLQLCPILVRHCHIKVKGTLHVFDEVYLFSFIEFSRH